MLESETDASLVVTESKDSKDLAVLTPKDSHMNYAAAELMKPRLKLVVGEFMDQGRRRFIVDLGNVVVMDSCGLAVLISLKKLVEGRGGSLALTGMNEMARRLFQLTRLNTVFKIQAEGEDAVKAG